MIKKIKVIIPCIIMVILVSHFMVLSQFQNHQDYKVTVFRNPDGRLMGVRANDSTRMWHRPVAIVDVETPGYYKMVPRVVYSNDEKQQNNESFYMTLVFPDLTISTPVDSNAGPYRVIPDSAALHDTVWRDTGTFYFSGGVDTVWMHHYAAIARKYDQFLIGGVTVDSLMRSSNSVLIDTAFWLVSVPDTFNQNRNEDGALELEATTPRIQVIDGIEHKIAYPGETVNYKLVIRNRKDTFITGGQLYNQVPELITASGFSFSPIEQKGSEIIWKVPFIAPFDSFAITFNGTLFGEVPIGLTALVDSAFLNLPYDSTTANNSASVKIHALSDPDLLHDGALKIDATTLNEELINGQVHKIAYPGEPVYYRMIIKNTGVNSITSGKVYNWLPALLKISGFSYPPIQRNGSEIIWQLPIIASQDSFIITFTAILQDQIPYGLTTLLDSAKIDIPGDKITSNDTSSVITHALSDPRLILDGGLQLQGNSLHQELVEGLQLKIAYPGESVVYKLIVRNLGLNAISSSKLDNWLPAFLAASNFSYPPTAQAQSQITWELPNIAVNDSFAITFAATLLEEIPEGLTPLPDSAKLVIVNDRNNTNNVAVDTIYALSDSSMLLDGALAVNATTLHETIIDGKPHKILFPGETVNYQFVVRNAGINSITSALLYNWLPSFLTVTGFTYQPLVQNNIEIQWQLPIIAPLDSFIISVTAVLQQNIPAGLTPLPDSANLVVPDDRNPANNTGSARVYALSDSKLLMDATLTMAATTPHQDIIDGILHKIAYAGEVVNYTMVIKNKGMTTVTNGRLYDYLPEYVSASEFSYQPLQQTDREIIWQLPNMAPEDSFKINFSAIVAEKVPMGLTPLENSAKLFVPGDNNMSNDSASVTVYTVSDSIRQHDGAVTAKATTPLIKIINGTLHKIVYPGETVDYNLTIKNQGIAYITSGMLYNRLPGSLSIVEFSYPPVNQANNEIGWQLPIIAPGDSFAISFKAMLPGPVPAGLTPLLNTVELVVPGDTYSANNVAGVTVYAAPDSNLFLDGSLEATARTRHEEIIDGQKVKIAYAGETIDYKLIVKNQGILSINSGMLYNNLPAFLTVTEFSLTPTVQTGNQIAWQLPIIAPQDSFWVTLKTQVAANIPTGLTTLVNYATLAIPNDGNAANDSAAVTIYALSDSTLLIDGAVSFLAKTDHEEIIFGEPNQIAYPDETVDYKLIVFNKGIISITTARLYSWLPASLTVTEFSLAPLEQTNTEIIWQLPNIAPQDSLMITFKAKLPETVPDGLTPLLASTELVVLNDNNPANDMDAITIYALSNPDLLIDGSLEFDATTDHQEIIAGENYKIAYPGEIINYKLVLRNQGLNSITAGRLYNSLPQSLTIASFSHVPLAQTETDIIWQLPHLAPQDSFTITYTAMMPLELPAGLTLLNSSASLSIPDDINSANDSAAVTVYALSDSGLLIDGALKLDAITGTEEFIDGQKQKIAYGGEQVNYNLTINNFGLITITSGKLHNTLPPSLTAIAFSLEPAEQVGSEIIWNLPQLAPQDSLVVTVTAMLPGEVPAGLTALENIAKLVIPNDINPSNDTDTATIYAASDSSRLLDGALAFLARTGHEKIINGKTLQIAYPGETVGYKIVTRNQGLIPITAARINSKFPDSLSIDNFSYPPLGQTKTEIIWQTPRITSQDSFVINFKVTLSETAPAGLTPLLSVADLAIPGDRNGTNNSAAVTIYLFSEPEQMADLALSLTAKTDSVMVTGNDTIKVARPGQEIKYNLSVMNHGPAFAEDVLLTCLIPGSMIIENTSIPPQYESRDTLVWKFDALAPDSSRQILYSGKVANAGLDAASLLITEAQVMALNDTLLNNNFAADTVHVMALQPYLDIQVSQFTVTDSFTVVGKDTFKFVRDGETYRYYVVVENLSPVDAKNVIITDIFPDSVTVENYQPNLGRLHQDSIVWHLETLPARSIHSLWFDATVAAIMPYGLNYLVNRVQADAENENSIHMANNIAIDTVYHVKRYPVEYEPLIEASPLVVDVTDSINIRVQVPIKIATWDLWIYYQGGQVEKSFGDTYIAKTILVPGVWYDVDECYQPMQLFGTEKEEQLIFELRTRDPFGYDASARAIVMVHSSNKMVLDRNVFKPDSEEPINIRFKLSSKRNAKLDIYDINGRHVMKLAEEVFEGGWNTYTWNGLGESGIQIGSGVYLVTLRADDYNSWKKFIIVR